MNGGTLEPLRAAIARWRDVGSAAALATLAELAGSVSPVAAIAVNLHQWTVDRSGVENLWAYLETMVTIEHERFGVLESAVSELDHEVSRLIARGGRRAIDAESRRLASLMGAVVADGVQMASESGEVASAHLLIDVVGSLHEAELTVLAALEATYPDPLADHVVAEVLRQPPRMTMGALTADHLAELLPGLALVVPPAIKRLEARGLVRDVLDGSYDGSAMAVGGEPVTSLPGRWSATEAGRYLLRYLEEIDPDTD